MPYEKVINGEGIEWKPHARQERFVELPFEIFEALFGGAAGGGKTEILLMLPILYGWINHPRFKGLFLRRTFPELESEVIPRSKEFYKPWGGKYNEGKKRWTFPSGAIVQFGHVEDEKDVFKYDTAQYNYIAFDELTSFTEFIYTFLTSRCRSASEDLPAVVRAATNPGNVGHNWVRRRFVEPARDGNTLIHDQFTGTYRIFIPSKLSDNPHLLKNDPNYGSRLKILGEAERRAKLDGDWWTFTGQMFAFREEPLLDEPENAQHVIEPFPIPDYWPKVIAVDWGSTAMTIALFGAISPDNRIYIFKEYAVNGTADRPTKKGVKLAEWATEIGFIASELSNVKDAVLDANAWEKKADSEETIADQVMRYSNISFRSADKGMGSRIAGVQLLHDLLRWEPKPRRRNDLGKFDEEQAQRVLRWAGIEAYKKYLQSFVEEPPEENLPRLQIFSSCPEVLRVIPMMTIDKDNPNDVNEFSGDDPYDCLRYLVRAITAFLGASQTEQKAAEVQARLDKIKDHTQYHIAKAKMESTLPKSRVMRGGSRLRLRCS